MKDTLLRFRDTVPRNETEWSGSVVMYDGKADEFYSISFGSGDNLDAKDIEDGIDDYMMVDRYELDGTVGSAWVTLKAVASGKVDESTEGLRLAGGGQWPLRRKEWPDGDVRRFIGEAMKFAGFRPEDGDDPFVYVTYIASER